MTNDIKRFLFIGTSGFSYSHWENGIFYPKNLPKRKQLEYYSQHFNTVELNSPFYHLPKKETFSKWREEVGDNFLFSLKVSKSITHIKRLNDCERDWREFFERAKNLKEKLGPFLFQFPPNFKKDVKVFQKFLKILPKNYLFAFEFRHPSWFSNEVYKIFKKRKNTCFCWIDSPKWPQLNTLVGDFLYIRFHGKESLYRSCYSEKELKEWSEVIKKYLKKGFKVFVYFNNDFQGFAVQNAKTLASYLK